MRIAIGERVCVRVCVAEKTAICSKQSETEKSKLLFNLLFKFCLPFERQQQNSAE